MNLSWTDVKYSKKAKGNGTKYGNYSKGYGFNSAGNWNTLIRSNKKQEEYGVIQ